MKKKILMLGVICLSLFLVTGLTGCGQKYESGDENTDALKFKEEYESLNDTVRESDGAEYNNISIDENNPIKYVNIDEAIGILESETAILYIGANWCPWCRNAIPVLFDVAKDNDVNTIYYLNIDDEKDVYEVEDGKLVKTTEGTESYYELLDLLDEELEDYVITNKDGKKFDTKEKRIYMPFVVAVKNGKISSSHTGTVDLDKDQTKYSKLTDDQYDELYNTYNKMIEKIFSKGTCSTNGKCD